MFNGSPLDKRPLWYSNPVGDKTPVVDEWGNETGETSQTWSDPAKLMLNVSPPTGSAEANPFGAFTDYSYVVSSSSKKHNTPLYEGTRLVSDGCFKALQLHCGQGRRAYHGYAVCAERGGCK